MIGLTICALLLWCRPHRDAAPRYFHNQGHVFGTYYNLRYSADHDLQAAIDSAFAAFDASLSMFNPRSILSAVNQNRDTTTDLRFEQMFAQAMEVSRLSHGAFDITVAPLVNLWGFGFKHREDVTPERVDSARQLIGFTRVRLVDHHILKDDPRIMLDAGAVAKGQACDVLITGDIDYHTGIDALEQGLAVIDAGHYGIEKLFIPYMRDFMKRELKALTVHTAAVKEPFVTL